MKRSNAIITCLILVCLSILNSHANDENPETRTPEFKIKVPKDHLFLVAVDRGEPGNRKFIDDSGKNQAPGVDPVFGQMMRLPAEAYVSLAYPHKRENPKLSSVMWKVYAGYRYSEEESYSSEKEISGVGKINVDTEFKTDWDWEIGYNFKVETKVQRIIYQQDGQVHNDFVRNIIETPVTPKLEEIETGVEGAKLYQIPFGEVDGVTRYIVVLISDDFESASETLLISNENPKFKWNTDWFHEKPTTKQAEIG
jgi:hypothetical protein